ncbi:unnamed protein product, partial [Anisakis simplex]|uniref:Cadherin domain-containing protein n=1 Tax=Anisakis simplex TaxID=6269 RepID=A0A0M3KGC8_ANISI
MQYLRWMKTFSGNLPANGPMIASKQETVQITAASEAPERILNETTKTLENDDPVGLNISVKIGPLYSFKINQNPNGSHSPPVIPPVNAEKETNSDRREKKAESDATKSTTKSNSKTKEIESEGTTKKTKSEGTTKKTESKGTTKKMESDGTTKKTESEGTTSAIIYETTHGSTVTSTHGFTAAPDLPTQIDNWTKNLAPSSRVEISVRVEANSSYSFSVTDVVDAKPTKQIQVKVTMCNANESDAQLVNSSKDGLYEISATEIQRFIIKFNCSHKSRVRRSSGKRDYQMDLFIYADKGSTSKNITIVGTLTPQNQNGSTPPPTTDRSSTAAPDLPTQIGNWTKNLAPSGRVEISFRVEANSSYSFSVTDVVDAKPTKQIQVKVTMCNANESDAQLVNSSKDGLYEISATEIQRFIIKFNCSHKSRVRRSSGKRDYQMDLFIYADKGSTSKNITI